MILVILVIFLAIWGWKKYATSQSNEGTLYSYYPKLGYYWVSLIVMAGFEMYAAYQAWTKGFEFATHDWANDLSGLFGLDYLYSLYKDSSAYSDYMSSLSSRASEITGPLLTAWLLTSLINIIVIGTCVYCWINLPKGKVSKEKTLKLGLIAGIAVIVTYMWLSLKNLLL